ncbi:MAG: hypothetical protein ACTSV3_08120 [Candidatus Thorarchaeota archaeon]|nr:MAG: hypothetical protein DRP09_06930 [Candidatus Thorarchaeota archaeon]
MFTCKKCKEPFYAQGAEIRGQTLRVYCQCLNGHKGKRDISRYQADSMAHDVFSGLFTCVECGSITSLTNTDMGRSEVEYTFLCPIHGEQKKRIPAFYHTSVTGLQKMMNSAKPILDSMFCQKCNQVFSAKEIIDRKRFYEVRYQCPNGHKELRFIPKDADESIIKTVLKRLIHCDECGLPCQLIETTEKGGRVRVEVACPAHGSLKKEIPAEHAWLLDRIFDTVSEGSIVRSMLKCRECSEPLSIRSIELDKSKYRLKCGCPNGHTTEMSQPTDLDEEAVDAIVNGLLKCNQCNLLTDLVESRQRGQSVEVELVCPVHGPMKKGLSAEVFSRLEDREKRIDRSETIEQSLKCEKCSSPVLIRDTKVRDSIVEMKVECRNGHRAGRYASAESRPETLARIYRQLYECHKCHKPLNLVRIDEMKDHSEVTLNCEDHGELTKRIPQGHESAVRLAFISTRTIDDLKDLLETRLPTQRACEFQMDKGADPQEMLDIVQNIIEQHSVEFIDEQTDPKTGLEAWYYGKALVGDEFVVIGSVSAETLAIRISVASNDEEKLDALLSEMRESLREVLLRIHDRSEDTGPRKIECVHCGAALPKRALPGETVICDHCGTPLHWD